MVWKCVMWKVKVAVAVRGPGVVGRGPSQKAAPVVLGSLSFCNFSLNDSPTSQQPKHPHPSPTPLGKVRASFVNRMGFVNEMPPVGPAGQGTGTSNSRRGFLELDHKPGPASPGRAGWGVVRAGQRGRGGAQGGTGTDAAHLGDPRYDDGALLPWWPELQLRGLAELPDGDLGHRIRAV